MKTKVCPKCGESVVRLGGGFGFGNLVFRIEFCTNRKCNWTRKLYRIFPEHGERDWKECK
jgi:hypothetical protein